VIGPNGRGLAAEENLHEDVDVQMGTLSKALGVSGGYICGSRSLIEWLINRARSFIYSTAPPSALAAAAIFSPRRKANSAGSYFGKELSSCRNFFRSVRQRRIARIRMLPTPAARFFRGA